MNVYVCVFLGVAYQEKLQPAALAEIRVSSHCMSSSHAGFSKPFIDCIRYIHVLVVLWHFLVFTNGFATAHPIRPQIPFQLPYEVHTNVRISLSGVSVRFSLSWSLLFPQSPPHSAHRHT